MDCFNCETLSLHYTIISPIPYTNSISILKVIKEHNSKIVDEVHDNDTKIIMQIAHCGRQTRSKTTGLPTVAPSAIRDKMYNKDKPKELSESEIHVIIENFAEVALRCKKAGCEFQKP